MPVDIAKARKKFEEVKKRTTANENFMNLEDGQNVVRLLSFKDFRDWFIEVGYHYITIGKERKAVVCLQLTDGESCYFCDLRSELSKSKDTGDKALGKKLKPNMRIFCNVLNRLDGNALKILPTGNMVFKQILSYLGDTEWGDLTDPEKGRDIVIEKTRTGSDVMDIEYSVRPKPNSSPVGVDYSTLELFDLEEIPDRLSYEEQKALFEGEGDLSVEDAKVPDKKSVVATKSAQHPTATVRKPVRAAKAAPEESKTSEKTEAQHIADIIKTLDLSDQEVMSKFMEWNSSSRTLLDLLKVKEFADDKKLAASAPAHVADESELDDAIQKALEKYKKPSK